MLELADRIYRVDAGKITLIETSPAGALRQ